MTQSRQVSSGSSKTFGHLSRSLYAALVAFLTYASVYAYRKPFTVASFDGIHFWGVPYQTLLVIAQVFGYMASKFFGIKFIHFFVSSEVQSEVTNILISYTFYVIT